MMDQDCTVYPTTERYRDMKLEKQKKKKKKHDTEDDIDIPF